MTSGERWRRAWARGADGGIVVVTFTWVGQKPSTRVYRLDDMLNWEHGFLAQTVAVARLKTARD